MNTRLSNTVVRVAAVVGMTAVLCDCGSGTKKQTDFFTSGSHEADQRAEQRIAKADQLRGKTSGATTGDKQPVKQSLYERLGGETGLRAIVADFVDRAIADPRVNWERNGITSRSLLGLRSKSETWKATQPNVEKLKLHITQFLELSTGGPTKYEGRDIKESHAGMKITNSEFDAAVGDMKATLDKTGVGVSEQKELLAILESTRPEIVEKR
jgi:hemoglobin